jgi:cobalt-zinc-cadmium resistance protein CzcA
MERMVEWLCRKKNMMIVLLAVIAMAGYLSFRSLKIDVFPDPSPVMVQIFTESEGLAPEEMEKFVSYPIERTLFGLPGVRKITSFSTFGLSTVNAYFEDGVDIYFARQLVSQKITAVASSLPDGVEAPEIGPITTGLGMVYVYCMEGEKSVMELRTLQDWVVKFQLQTLPGIATILSHGGEVQQYQVVVDPDKLTKYGLDLHTLIDRIRGSSRNITAGYIIRDGEEYIVRGLGLFTAADDLRQVVVKEVGAVPVLLGQIARIVVGPAIKRGEALLDEKPGAVSGIVMKLIGVNTADLIRQIDARLSDINRGLPEGIRLVPVYNQAKIIEAAFKTVSEALLIGILLVAAILFLFINDLSSAFVSALAIPFSVLVTFILMRITGQTADLMSFGGLAIGIGLLVDATVVVVENISRLRRGGFDTSVDKKTIVAAVGEVIRPLLQAMVIIVLVFIPILTLSGVEGKMFRPFGFTLVVAVAAAILYAVFVSPVLMHVLGSRRVVSTGMIFDRIRKWYLKVFDFFYRREKAVILLFSGIFLLSLFVLSRLGSEFIPRLNEKTIQLETVMAQNTPLAETVKTVGRIHAIVGGFNEVDRVFGRVGSGEAGTHPHPVNVGHSIITLQEREAWDLDNEDQLINRIEEKIHAVMPGVLLNFTKPIRHNLDHMLTGIKADLAIKIYGDDYSRLLHFGEEVESILRGVSGVKDVQLSRVVGQNQIRIRVKRGNLARYGLNPADVLEEVEAAIGGRTVEKIYHGDVVFDVFLRYEKDFRKDIKDLKRYFIHAENGRMIPLAAVAHIEEDAGWANINRENGKRFVSVQCNVRGRDIGGVVDEVTRLVYERIEFPFGYYLDWGGQFELKRKAERGLAMILALTLLLILILLYNHVRSWRDLTAILVNLPISLSGGVLTLWLAGAYLSVPATIGFIALLGIALENTLLLISFIRRRVELSGDFDQAVRESVALRLRPILMTKFTTIFGLLPLIFTAGIGAEIQRPLALVVVGGIFFSIFTTLLLMPVIYRRLQPVRRAR